MNAKARIYAGYSEVSGETVIVPKHVDPARAAAWGLIWIRDPIATVETCPVTRDVAIIFKGQATIRDQVFNVESEDAIAWYACRKSDRIDPFQIAKWEAIAYIGKEIDK